MRSFYLSFVLLGLFGFGCGRETVPEPTPVPVSPPVVSPVSSDSSFSSPSAPIQNSIKNTTDQVWEGLIVALESNDPVRASEFFGSQGRDRWVTLFKKADLSSIARDLRTHPPERLDDPEVSTTYATFWIVKTIQGEEKGSLASMYVEGGEWKLTSL